MGFAAVSEPLEVKRHDNCCRRSGRGSRQEFRHDLVDGPATGAEIVAVACPFCMQMFEASVGGVPAAVERSMQVFDLAELLDMKVVYPTPKVNPASIKRWDSV